MSTSFEPTSSLHPALSTNDGSLKESSVAYPLSPSGGLYLEELHDEDQNLVRERALQSLRYYSILATISLACAIGMLIFTFIAPSTMGGPRLSLPTGSNNDILRSPCGTSAAQARSMGCHFDIITFSWLPDRCYDAELSAAFDAVSQWEYYLDHNGTQAVSKAEALTGDYDGLYVSWKYHIYHCVYMWEKMHRALLGEGKPAIDGYIGPLAHTHHCGKMLTARGKGYDFDDYNTRIRVKYPDCGIA